MNMKNEYIFMYDDECYYLSAPLGFGQMILAPGYHCTAILAALVRDGDLFR